MKVFKKYVRLGIKEERKSENEWLDDFTKTKLKNFAQKTISRARQLHSKEF